MKAGRILPAVLADVEALARTMPQEELDELLQAYPKLVHDEPRGVVPDARPSFGRPGTVTRESDGSIEWHPDVLDVLESSALAYRWLGLSIGEIARMLGEESRAVRDMLKRAARTRGVVLPSPPPGRPPRSAAATAKRRELLERIRKAGPRDLATIFREIVSEQEKAARKPAS